MKAFQNITYLMIETNSSCNLSCSWCNRERLVAEGHRENKNLSLEEFKKLLEYFKDCPIDTIKLEGLSEPFLHPHFDQLAKLLREYFPKAFVIIATNGQYNIEKTKFFQTLPYVDMIYLSVDGLKENFEKIRKGASWEKLIKNFDTIDRIATPDEKKKLHINFTANEENVRELPGIYQLKDQYKFSSVRINIVQNWNEDELSPENFSEDYYRILKQYKKDLKGVPGWDYEDCFWPYSGLVVDVYGNFRQCIINTSQKPLGNVFTSNVEEFFNDSPYYLNVREKLSNNCSPESCRTCDYKHHSEKLLSLLGEKHAQNTPRSFKR